MNSMHDWTLETIRYEWRAARLTILLGVFGAPELAPVRLVAEGVVDLHIPQRSEWGPSASVNEYQGPMDIGGGLQRLTIEMQSGDVIAINARRFEIPPEASISWRMLGRK